MIRLANLMMMSEKIIFLSENVIRFINIPSLINFLKLN